MQMEAPWIRGLPTTWVNVTPPCWAWPVATTMFSRQQWWGKDLPFYVHVRSSTRIFALSALHCYHICPGHVYLYLPSCYFKVSSAMTPRAPIHENINNWSPPVKYVALHVISWRDLFSGTCRGLFLSSRADAQIEAFWERGQHLYQQSSVIKTQPDTIMHGNHAELSILSFWCR